MAPAQSPYSTPQFTGISDHHACYFAHELTRHAAQGIDQLSASLFDAAVDLNPHQIEAALYFFRSPTVKGVLLADEVGLGKTIEASLILGQLWAEKKRRLLIVCPASLRKQWSLELREKFNLPSFILDARSYALDMKAGNPAPADRDAIVIIHPLHRAQTAYCPVPACRERAKALRGRLDLSPTSRLLRTAAASTRTHHACHS